MDAQCVRIEYQASQGRQAVKGVKKGATEGFLANGVYLKPRQYAGVSHSYGWGDVYHSSKLILFVLIDGQEVGIWIDHFFKRNYGSLIQKRRNAIEKAMPQLVRIDQRVSGRGTKYYIVCQDELQAWLGRINAMSMTN